MKHITTVDKLWKEFQKCIASGNWDKFKTKDEFKNYLKDKIKETPGLTLRFFFMSEKKTFKVTLPITPSLLQELGIQKEKP